MNRLKVVLFLIVLIIVGILLGQNRELLSLKFFCPDISSASCLYLTPALPLAAWMGIFALAGIISSLIWQLLNQAAIPTSKATRSYSSVENKVRSRQEVEYTRPPTPVNSYNSSSTNTVTNNRPPSDWEQPKNEDWEANTFPNAPREVKTTLPTTEPLQKPPQNTSPSDSIYSYKFREADEPKKDSVSDRQKSSVDDVYDATYRTVNNPQSTTTPYNNEEEDEEWI